jgi:multidrug transporter EmrE-like cation transporter
MKFSILGFLLIGGILLTLGDIALKKWAVTDKYSFYTLGLFLYLIGVIFFSFTLREKNLAIANTILVTVNIISLVAISYFYFQEKLTAIQFGGIILCMIGVVMLELGAK